MRKGRIRSVWASVIINACGQPVVCCRVNGALQCLRFVSCEHLAEALRNRRLCVDRWASAVPGDLCVRKSIGLPAEDFPEAAQMVGFEIPALIPMAREELTYGCTLRRKHQKGMDLFVWIHRRDILNEYLAPYRDIGIEPEVILPDMVAIQRWFASHIKSHTLATVDVLVSAGQTTIVMNREGHLQIARRFPPADDGDCQPLWDAITETVPGSEDPTGPPEERTVVCFAGDNARASHMRLMFSHSVASDRYECSTVETAPPVAYPLNGEPLEPCDGCHGEAVIAEGLLLWLSDPHLEQMNLVPEECATRRRRRARWYAYAWLIGLSLYLLVVAWALLVVSNLRLAKQCRLVRAEMAPIRDTANAVAGKRQQLRAIQRQLSNRGQMAQLFQELYKHTPTTISFYELTFNRQQDVASLEIKGQADFLPTALEYTNAVRDAGLLAGLQIASAQQTPQAGGGSTVEFKANCTIRSGR